MGITVGQGQTRIFHFSQEESQTAIAALCFRLKNSFNTHEANWPVDAYYGLTKRLEESVRDVDGILHRVERSRDFIARLSTHLHNPNVGLKLSDAEFEHLGQSLYTYGVIGFHNALRAIHKIGFISVADESRTIEHLKLQNERAFALFKRLEQHVGNALWMMWPQANMEHAFAPGT